MRCRILHESRGRMRVHMDMPHMTLMQADILEYYLKTRTGISGAKVYDRTRDAVINYECAREDVIADLASFAFKGNEELVPEHTGRAMNREYEDKLIFVVANRAVRRFLFPTVLRRCFAIVRTLRYVKKAMVSLKNKKLDVAVLDATAISVSMLRGDIRTATSIMFLLKIGDLLEEWTHKKSVADLASALSLGVDKVWTVTDGTEVLMPVNQVKLGDLVVVRTGNMIPFDGLVMAGEAMVNQASITGESMPVRKVEGGLVYAGTVVDEGECTFRVDRLSGEGRYDRIAKMIEESEKLKSTTEMQAASLADGLVPYSLGGTILTYLLTRNVTKALSFLMVDFSCALKLAMPLSVLSAMREAGEHGITVKGGKFMEAVSNATTIVFDKTGTLTNATPHVARVIPFGGSDETEMLRLAACLEEHYPHSIANAVVEEAVIRDLKHEERHTKALYIVAHGIASSIEGKKVVIGSYHFVMEDEGVSVPEGDEKLLKNLPPEYSHLYLAIGGVLSAVICIEDPLRPEAREVVRKLHELGIDRVVMMTGDNERTAHAVAEAVGVDAYQSEVLPEDKAAFVRAEHEAGRAVIMVGDGVNDSPALSEADAGIAISAGAAIAREVADITISADDLYSLITLRTISDRLMDRISGNYRLIMSFNFGLILLGAAGVMQPATAALFHNTSTILIGLKSMTRLLS